MYISHLITAPFLLHRYFPSKVNPITLAMASVTPDILSNLYLVMMEVMRILIKQKVEIHDHTKPPGWIELDSGQPLGVGRWTHSLGGAMCLAGLLSLLTALYYAARRQTHMKTPPITPPATPATMAEKIDKIAPLEVLPPRTLAEKLIRDPHIYRAMLAVGLAVMSHIFLDTIGENPKALLHPFSLPHLASSDANSRLTQTTSTHVPKPSADTATTTSRPTYPQTPIYLPIWTLAIDSFLALLTTYLYTLNPHISRKSRLRLAGLAMLLMIVEGCLYFSRPTSLVVTTTVSSRAPGVAGAWWSLVRHVCGAILVGGVLQSIPRHLGAHLGDAGREGEGVGEMLRRGMEKLKGEISGVGELPSLPLTPCGEKTYEVNEVEESTAKEALQGGEKDQEKQEKEKQRGVKRDLGFWGSGAQGTSAHGDREIKCIGVAEGEPLPKDARGSGTLPQGGAKLSPSPTDSHQEKRRRKSSHGTYADAVQGRGHSEAGNESPVFVDEPGGAVGYSYGQGLPGAGGGRRTGGAGAGGGTRKAYIH